MKLFASLLLAALVCNSGAAYAQSGTPVGFTSWTMSTRPKLPYAGQLGYNQNLQVWEWWNPASNSWQNPATVNPTGDISNSTVTPFGGQTTLTNQLLSTFLPKAGDITGTHIIVNGVTYNTAAALTGVLSTDVSNATATATGGGPTKSMADWFAFVLTPNSSMNVSGATRTPTGANTVPDTLANAASYQINAQNFGAKFDGVYAATGVTITAGLNALRCTSCAFTAADVGKIVYLQNANTNGGWWKDTIASFTDSTHVVLTNNAPNPMTSSTPGATVTVASAGTGYGLYDHITLTGGTPNNSANTQLIVAALKVSGATITASGGSGSGTCTVTGTTGSGGHQSQKFTGTVAMTSGSISGVAATITNGGIYIISPASLSSEPVTITGSGCPATSTASSVTMGVGQAIVDPANPGSYSSAPSGTISQGSTTGSGSGATFTIAYGTSQSMYYGTDNGPPITNAISYCSSQVTTSAPNGGGCTIKVPNGIGLTSQGFTINKPYVSIESFADSLIELKNSGTSAFTQSFGSRIMYVNNAPPTTGYVFQFTPISAYRLTGNYIHGIDIDCNAMPGCSGISVNSLSGGRWGFAVNQAFPAPYSVTGSTAVSSQTINNATVVAGGSGGTAGSAIYQIGGGTCTTQPRLNVTVSGGAVSAIVSVNNPGACSANPPNGSSLTYVSGTGSGVTGATVNPTVGGGSLITLSSTAGIQAGQVIEADGFISGTYVAWIVDGNKIAASTVAAAPLASGGSIYIEGVGMRTDTLGGLSPAGDTQNMDIRSARFYNQFGPGLVMGGSGQGPQFGNSSVNYIHNVTCYVNYGDCVILNNSDHNTFDLIGATTTFSTTSTGRTLSSNASLDPHNGQARYNLFNQIGGDIRFRGTDEGGFTTAGSFNNRIYFASTTSSLFSITYGTGASACVTLDRGTTSCNNSSSIATLSPIVLDYSGMTLANPTTSGAPIAAPLMTPSSSSAACTAGSVKWDASFIYVCTATNTWKRATLATF